jgi:GTP 3',8-cyclase
MNDFSIHHAANQITVAVRLYNSPMLLALPIFDAGPVKPAFAQGPRSLSAVRLLRISVTDRCNLRCVYCMPDDGVGFHDSSDLLSADQIITVASAARRAGVDHFKLTGGEPTVRSDLLPIVRGIASLKPADLSLTTNGLLLDRLAKPLRDAGVDRVTVSLDSLRPDRFARITRGGVASMGGLARLMRGLDALSDAGFSRVKINVVVMQGFNDDEVADLARLSIERDWTVRFIEYMPLGQSTIVDDAADHTLDNAVVRARIEAVLGPLTAVLRESETGVGPATVFSLPGARGRVGFISAMSKPFCETCNRLRLTATGQLRSCLFDGGEVDVLPTLNKPGGADADELIELMSRCVALKPQTHSDRGNRAMSQIGG